MTLSIDKMVSLNSATSAIDGFVQETKTNHTNSNLPAVSTIDRSEKSAFVNK